MHQRQIRTLYKAILRIHRSLPNELRVLGDGYVRDEFRRQSKSGNEGQNKLFITEWTDYYQTLAQQVRPTPESPQPVLVNLGKPLASDKIDEFEPQQIYQLYELKLATEESEVPHPPNSRTQSQRKSDEIKS